MPPTNLQPLLNPQVASLLAPVLVILGFVVLTMIATIVAAIRGYRKFQAFVEAAVKSALELHMKEEKIWQGEVTGRQESMAVDLHAMKKDVREIKRKLGLTRDE